MTKYRIIKKTTCDNPAGVYLIQKGNWYIMEGFITLNEAENKLKDIINKKFKETEEVIKEVEI